MKAVENLIEIRNVAKHGGSLALNIPAEMAKKMGLSAGSPVVFRYDHQQKKLYVEKIAKIETPKGDVIPLND